jgi:hypothetical protein
MRVAKEVRDRMPDGSYFELLTPEMVALPHDS